MGKTSLPPGFRFHPTDEELVVFYLKRKVMGKKLPPEVITVLDIYKFVPQDLPDKSCLKSRDLEWYFFCPRKRKYASGEGGRVDRTTESGHWKTTGNDKKVEYRKKTVGHRRTLIFHLGRASHGKRTDWVMHEYRLEDNHLAKGGIAQDAFVLCKIFQKSGRGPQNGAQYGAPFNEEEWDSEDEANQIESLPFSRSYAPAIVLNDNQSNSILRGIVGHGDSLSEFPSSSGPSADQVLPSVLDYDNPELQPDDKLQPDDELQPGDELLSMLEGFRDDDIYFFNENDENEVDKPSHAQNVDEAIPVEGNDIFKDLMDLENPAEMNKYGFISSSDKASLDQWPPYDSFLELHDLDPPLNISAEGSGSGFGLPGGVCMGYDSCNNAERFDYQFDDFGVMHHASASSPYIPVLEDGPYGFENRKDADLEKCAGENVKQGDLGYESASYNKKRPEPDSGHEDHAQKRGKEQTKSYSRMQHLIESIPSRPASAAEHPGSSNGLRKNAMITVLCPSVGVGRYTEEGESDNLGYCGCSNLYRRRRRRRGDLRKEPAAAAAAVACWDGNLMFILFLGLLSVLMWVFIAAIIMKLGRFAWDLLLFT